MFKHYKKMSHWHRSLYYLITGIGIIIFWRGIWGLLDVYLFPDNPALSYIISTIGGLLILFLNDFSIEEIG